MTHYDTRKAHTWAVFGEYRTGKTQLAHTLCVQVQLPIHQGGANSKAGKFLIHFIQHDTHLQHCYIAYIDTEGTFRPDRIRAIADRFGVDPDITLDNIAVARAWNSDHQMDLITEIAAKFAEEKGIYRLLIVDSIIALFRCDYAGRGELAERQQKLNQMLNRLTKIAEEYNVAVFLTNQVSSDPGGKQTSVLIINAHKHMFLGGMVFVSDPKKPVGGHILVRCLCSHSSCSHSFPFFISKSGSCVSTHHPNFNLHISTIIFHMIDLLLGCIYAKDVLKNELPRFTIHLTCQKMNALTLFQAVALPMYFFSC